MIYQPEDPTVAALGHNEAIWQFADELEKTPAVRNKLQILAPSFKKLTTAERDLIVSGGHPGDAWCWNRG